jgi:hypothetical protein
VQPVQNCINRSFRVRTERERTHVHAGADICVPSGLCTFAMSQVPRGLVSLWWLSDRIQCVKSACEYSLSQVYWQGSETHAIVKCRRDKATPTRDRSLSSDALLARICPHLRDYFGDKAKARRLLLHVLGPQVAAIPIFGDVAGISPHCSSGADECSTAPVPSNCNNSASMQIFPAARFNEGTRGRRRGLPSSSAVVIALVKFF